jgi:hypothetical protein
VLRLPVSKPRPKGLAAWSPRPGSKNHRIFVAAQAALDRYAAAGRLPLGSREVGYVLTGDEYGFTKEDIDLVEDVLVRARRAGLIDWDEISDGRTGETSIWTVRDGEDGAEQLLDGLDDAQLDRQAGQAFRVEVWAEAMGWLTRLQRDCKERGVQVYSGSGSVPVSAVRDAARRAIDAWLESIESPEGPQVRTVLLSVGDLDLNGIRNIARPFAEDVATFARDYGAPDELGLVTVRRILLTADQVEQHVGERGRSKPTTEAIKAGWPYPFTAQAEALPPEVRDGIVADAIDALHDVALRDRVIAEEEALHAAMREALKRKLA